MPVAGSVTSASGGGGGATTLTARGEVSDAPAEALEISRLPDAPAGMEVSRVDVVIRLRKAGV